jgi:hypothetical protein
LLFFFHYANVSHGIDLFQEIETRQLAGPQEVGWNNVRVATAATRQSETDLSDTTAAIRVQSPAT